MLGTCPLRYLSTLSPRQTHVPPWFAWTCCVPLSGAVRPMDVLEREDRRPLNETLTYFTILQLEQLPEINQMGRGPEWAGFTRLQKVDVNVRTKLMVSLSLSVDLLSLAQQHMEASSMLKIQQMAILSTLCLTSTFDPIVTKWVPQKKCLHTLTLSLPLLSTQR